MPLNRRAKRVAGVVFILLLLLPASFVTTFLAWPFWSWIEQTFGIESMGHSWPAEWCFIATYLCFAAVGGGLAWRL
jgi:hypothetical protein